MLRAAPPDGSGRRGLLPGPLVTVVAAVVAVVAAVSLVGQAVRSNAVVSRQAAPATVRDAARDDAFYRCIDVQARSLVRPGQTVALSTSNLADVVTLIKAVGSWATVADPASSAQVVLTLQSGRAGPGSCSGTVVVGTSRTADGRTVVRTGTGAEAPGDGPPPAPPL